MTDIDMRHIERFRTRTGQNHLGYLRQWQTWLDSRGVDLHEATRTDIEAWIAHMRDAGLMPSTVTTKASAVLAYYQWRFEEGLAVDNPGRYVTKPLRTRRLLREWLTAPELRALLAAADDAAPHIRAAIHLWALNGLRPAEPATIDIPDLGQYGGLPTITLRHRKGDTGDRISLSPPTHAAVVAAMDGRRSGPLLLHPNLGRRLDMHRARADLRHVLDAAGISKPVTPYGLRVSFITLSLEAGISERDVAASAGHISTAQIPTYDRLRHQVSADRHATHRLTTWLAGQGDETHPTP